MDSLQSKMMNIQEDVYHQYPAWSYSKIARYARNGFMELSKLDEQIAPTSEMEFGSLVDSLLTRGIDVTHNSYSVLSTPFPTPSVKTVLDTLNKQCGLPYNEIDDTIFLRVMNDCEWQQRWGYDARKKILDANSQYYETIRTKKKIVSKEDFEDAMDIYLAVKHNPYLFTIFKDKNTDNTEYLYQAQFIENFQINSHNDVKVKCMFDLLIVNHKEKTIQPVDLKTSHMPAYDFAKHFLKMRYDIQASLYTDVLNKTLINCKENTYKVLPYLFVDISRSDKVPVTYSFNTQFYSSGFTLNKEYFASWKQLLNEILDYKESQATTPWYIKTEEPNDLMSILNKNNLQQENDFEYE